MTHVAKVTEFNEVDESSIRNLLEFCKALIGVDATALNQLAIEEQKINRDDDPISTSRE